MINKLAYYTIVENKYITEVRNATKNLIFFMKNYNILENALHHVDVWLYP